MPKFLANLGNSHSRRIVENWKIIEDFPEYNVSDHGRVGHERTDRMVTVRINNTGVAYVSLNFKGKQRVRSLAKLVAEAFLKPHSPMHPIHGGFNTPINLDGDRLNNHVRNLAWRPLWFARKYHQQFEEGPYCTHPLMAMDTGVIYDNTLQAAAAYGVLQRELFASAHRYTQDSKDNRGVWPGAPSFKLVDWK